MSTEAMVWVLYNSRTTCGTDKVVLLGIASHADAYGRNAWPSHETLAEYANVDERNVRRCIARLREQGHITVDVQAGGNTKMRADRRPNLYSIPGCEGFPQAIRRGGASAPSRSSYGGARVTERGGAGVRDGGASAPPEQSLNHPEPSSEGETPTADPITEAARLHADRAFRNRTGDPVNDPGAWKDKARARWLAENAEEATVILMDHPHLDGKALLRKIHDPGFGDGLGYKLNGTPETPVITDEDKATTKAIRDALRESIPTARKREAS